MLTTEQIGAIRDQAGRLVDPVQEYILADIARRIQAAGQLTSTAQYQVWRLQNLGVSHQEIRRKLAQLMKVSQEEANRLLTQAAEVGYRYDLDKLPTAEAIPFEDNESLQQIVKAATELVAEGYGSITQTIGLLDPYGRALPLRDAYTACCDFAFMQVSTGASDYNTAVREACKHLADKGLVTIDYASGVHTSLEAAVRRSVMGGLGLMVEKTQELTHDQLGCDGWEISAHYASAPDHEPIQGKQYPDAEYKALNDSLQRRISTLNCGHIAFPIILGVNQPQYTSEQLADMREKNEEGITYAGKHYTAYEATQLQRKMERVIRVQKRRVLVSEAAGDAEKLTQRQIRLQRLNAEYKRFSRATALRTEPERIAKAGFGQQSAADAVGTTKAFDNFTGRLAGVQTGAGVTVQDVSPHVFGRMKERGIPESAVYDALTKPLAPGKIRADRTQQLVGERATVAINVDTGKVTTVWPTHTKLAQKLKAKKGGTPS